MTKRSALESLESGLDEKRMSEGQLQDLIRLELGRVDGLVLWRNQCGVAERGGRTMRFGVGSPGGADLIGIYRGRFLAVEIKTPTGRQTIEQRAFELLVIGKGGVYVVLRSVEDARSWAGALAANIP